MVTYELKEIKTELDFKEDYDRLNKFILYYTDPNESIPKYISQLRNIEQFEEQKSIYETREKYLLEISLDDLAIYDDSDLISRVERNMYSYLDLFYKVIDSNVDCTMLPDKRDVIYLHRLERMREKYPEKKADELLPPLLMRQYTIKIVERKNYSLSKIRSLNAQNVGQLVKIQGLITKISPTKPYIGIMTYICNECGSETFVESRGDNYLNILNECQSDRCMELEKRGALFLQTRGSKFINYQNVEIQEMAGEMPLGSVPVSYQVDLYENLSNQLKPGDFIQLVGIYSTRRYTGREAMKAGLLREPYIRGLNIKTLNRDEYLPNITEENIDNVAVPDVVYLIRSFAPNVYGMHDIKKLLLLSLLGSTDIKTADDMFIRGNINILLIGDPGVAKSQLLKTAVRLSSGIYTTGQGTSGAGLTASIVKDIATNENILSGGALVLADKTICAIDEMDKMSEYDRVSIHEVMEQHSISINKAGINTTLNARTTIIAACNPIGKYNKKRSLSKNLHMPISLLSRFDAIFLIEDIPDPDNDEQLAMNICNEYTEESLVDKPIFMQENNLKLFLHNAKKLQPRIPEHLNILLIDSYVNMREEYEAVTPRILLSTTRISIALAKLRMSEIVNEEDIEEAIRLSRISNSLNLKKKDEGSKITSKTAYKYEIYNIIMSLIKNSNIVEIQEVYDLLQSKYSQEIIDRVIISFEEAGVWECRDGKIKIYLS